MTNHMKDVNHIPTLGSCLYIWNNAGGCQHQCGVVGIHDHGRHKCPCSETTPYEKIATTVSIDLKKIETLKKEIQELEQQVQLKLKDQELNYQQKLVRNWNNNFSKK